MFKKIIKPMLLKEVDKPFNDNKYIYELKFDGIRAIIYARKKGVIIYNRHGQDITSFYPELLNIKNIIKNEEVIFDGEIIAMESGGPSFAKLQLRSHLKNPSKIKIMMVKVPVYYVAFDILYQNRNLMDKKLLERKKILDKYQDSDNFIKSKVYQDGLKLFEKVKKLKLEGIVAKKKESIYIPNSRVDYWLKIKNFKKEKFLIHGYIKNKQKYSLLLGEYKNKQLNYVGKVSVIEKNPLIEELKKLKQDKNIFINYKASAKYVKPKLKILVYYMERTPHNQLRQPFVKN